MILETERLILRPFRKEDAQDVFAYLHAPEVNCFACMKLDTLEDAEAEMNNRVDETEYYFAITLKESGKVIGEIDAYPETGDSHGEEDGIKDTFSPCWMLNQEYQGKGYAYEAAYAFFDYLFQQKGARRIYAYTEDYNLSSRHLCEKLGMRREGLFMEWVSFVNNPDGTPVYENTCQYAILKKEWEAGQQKKKEETMRKHPPEPVVFMNMCMVCRKDEVLALDKVNNTYTGTTFPGGHVEPGETFHDAVVREVHEETGLLIKKPVLKGVYHWYRDGIHNIGYLYRADDFEGELVSSAEGRVYWISREEYEKKELAVGMHRVLQIMDSDAFSECFMDVKEDGSIEEHMY